MFPTIFSTLFSMACISLHFGLIQANDGINIEFPPGRNNNYGLLLVFHTESAEYIPVCCDQLIPWTDQEKIAVRAAKVACEQAGYTYGWTEQYDRGNFESAAFTHLLCGEEATTLQECSSNVNFLEQDANPCEVYAGVYCFDTVGSVNYTAPSGTIRSPGYPTNYPNAAGFTYIIEMPEVTTITITFTTLALGQHDVLYNGKGNIPGRLNDFRSVSIGLPTPFELSTDSFWFRFASDLNGTDAGFSVEWNVNTLSTVTSDDNEISATSSSPSSQTTLSTVTSSDNEISATSLSPSSQTIPVSSTSSQLSTSDIGMFSTNKDTQTWASSTLTQTDSVTADMADDAALNGNGAIIGASVGVVAVIIIVVILILIYLKSRNKSDGRNNPSKVKPSTGLAFDSPYDLTILQGPGSSTFAENPRDAQVDESHLYQGGGSLVSPDDTIYHDIKNDPNQYDYAFVANDSPATTGDAAKPHNYENTETLTPGGNERTPDGELYLTILDSPPSSAHHHEVGNGDTPRQVSVMYAQVDKSASVDANTADANGDEEWEDNIIYNTN